MERKSTRESVGNGGHKNKEKKRKREGRIKERNGKIAVPEALTIFFL